MGNNPIFTFLIEFLSIAFHVHDHEQVKRLLTSQINMDVL